MKFLFSKIKPLIDLSETSRWILLLDFSVFIVLPIYVAGALIFGHYKISWEGICIFGFEIYNRFSRYIAHTIFSPKQPIAVWAQAKKIFRKWFFLLYTPHFIYSIWFAYWMIVHKFAIAALYVLIIWMVLFCLHYKIIHRNLQN